jgi:hypothetical protein
MVAGPGVILMAVVVPGRLNKDGGTVCTSREVSWRVQPILV